MKRTALRRQSPKRAALLRQRRAFVAHLLIERPWCEIKWDHWCTLRAQGVHEVVKRSHGGAIVPGEKAEAQGQRFIPACNRCNTAIEDNPAEARERGWA